MSSNIRGIVGDVLKSLQEHRSAITTPGAMNDEQQQMAEILRSTPADRREAADGGKRANHAETFYNRWLSPRHLQVPRVLRAVQAPKVATQIGNCVADLPIVAVEDTDGVGVPGVVVRFCVTQGTSEIQPPIAVTDASGCVSLSRWVLKTAGRHELQAFAADVVGERSLKIAAKVARTPKSGKAAGLAATP